MVYPTELNFTFADSLIINYLVDNPEKLKGLKLNNDSDQELECEDKNGLKQCNISKSHFKKGRYYYTYYINSYNSSAILYNVDKIRIILGNEEEEEKPESQDNLAIIIGSVVGGLVIIALIIFFIWRYKRKLSEQDLPKNEKILPESTNVELVEK